MNINEQLFDNRYQLLNAAQQKAVETIYGPVMVIAGPGTGKTEVLSMRIANLLRSDAQVLPSEILCLTYTEEAAFNMRKRLLQIVGQAAHKVNISTFHGFCNTVIQNNMEYFGVRNLDLISDLERVELMQNIITKLPANHPMHRVGNSIFYDIKSLTGFFNEMKKENWTEEKISNAVKEYLDDLPNREQYIYKQTRAGFKKGDVKQNDINAEKERMERTLSAASLFTEYNKQMNAIGRYDFNDMIIWVIEAFKQNSSLLQHYQERFQYILVDEFQDTNGAQNELLTQLTNFWEEPNIFVVGDDDQSIYEFQGARIKNILDFYERYKKTIKIILLGDNYRSSQPILDIANQSINNNKQRLLNAIEEVSFDKNVRSALPRFEQEETPQVLITSYYNIKHEEIAIVQALEALQEQGVAMNEVAVIYSQHKQAENIIALMERKNMAYTIRKNINVLDLMLPQQVLKIFHYLSEENKRAFSAEHLLFELMHAPYLGIDPTDMATLSVFLNSKEAKEQGIKYWRQLFAHEMLLSTLGLKSLTPILSVARSLDNWLQQLQILKLPMLLEKIVYDCGIVSWLLKDNEPVWEMQVLQTLFDFVKTVCISKPQTTIEEFLQIIDRMMDVEKIELPIQRIVQQEKGVRFYTAHSAKGLEFEYVFLIGCNKNFWEEKKGGKGLKLPDTLTRTVDENDNNYKIEVARRLFYVAMTRAKKYLNISYAIQDNDGKPLQASIFVDEISSIESRINKSIPTESLIEELAIAMRPVTSVYIQLINKGLLEKQLEHFALSASALSKYLKCPVKFYYEDVLKTPTAENDSMAFGTAIHYALERTFLEMNKSKEKEFPALENVLGYFKYKMRDKELAFTKIQFERRLAKGLEILTEYYTDNVNNWNKDVELEKWLQATIGEVPIKGKIDKIEKIDSFNCRVIDYKTGNPESQYAKKNLTPPNLNNEKGGDYWRQMVFYKLLLENQPFNKLTATEGVLEYVEKSKKNTAYGHKIFILPQDEIEVRNQIEDTYKKIKSLSFNEGCGEEDCSWCNFSKSNKLKLSVIEDD
jgi:DNA helicase II / ATP-dependent DNA helicase PcrA